MTIFAVLMPSPQPVLADTIRSKYPADHLMVTDTQWLISAHGTAGDISTTIGIYDPKSPNAKPTGSAIIFATSSYFGRAPTPVWDWIKTKLEASSG